MQGGPGVQPGAQLTSPSLHCRQNQTAACIYSIGFSLNPTLTPDSVFQELRASQINCQPAATADTVWELHFFDSSHTSYTQLCMHLDKRADGPSPVIHKHPARQTGRHSSNRSTFITNGYQGQVQHPVQPVLPQTALAMNTVGGCRVLPSLPISC